MKNRIEFNASHIFNHKKLSEEILTKYPEFKDDILAFILHIKRSVLIAVVLIMLITLMGAILKNI